MARLHSVGIPRVLLANELTDRAGAAWLAGELAADPGFDCYVYADSLAGVRLLDEVVRQASPARPLPVLVELGYPGGRTGCRDLAAAEAVARAVAAMRSLPSRGGRAGPLSGSGRDRGPELRPGTVGVGVEEAGEGGAHVPAKREEQRARRGFHRAIACRDPLGYVRLTALFTPGSQEQFAFALAPGFRPRVQPRLRRDGGAADFDYPGGPGDAERPNCASNVLTGLEPTSAHIRRIRRP